jgi:hypothetical protein
VFKKVTPEVTLDPNQKTDFEELIKKALPTHTTGPRSFEYDKSGYWLNPNGVPVTLTC